MTDNDTLSEKELWDLTGWVISSQYRYETLDQLDEGAKIPSAIARNTGREIAHISRALNNMRDRDLIELRTPGRSKGRIYAINDRGQAVLEKYREIED